MNQSIKNNISFYLLLSCFMLLCLGTTFAVSDAFMDSRSDPKWFAFYFGIALVLLVFALVITRKNQSLLIQKLDIVFGVIIALCLIQAVYGILQYFHFLSSHGNFRVTGRFDNPAGFAASLCAGVPFAFYLFRDKRKWVRIFTAIAVIITITAIVLSYSRAGAVSLIAVALAIVLMKMKTWRKAKVFVWVMVALFVLFSGLYFLKKDSADGRLLIWRVSLEMVKDKPVFGFGPGGFSANYMNYQAEYFKNNPHSKYILLAGNVDHPFNEYLLLLTNFGVVGFLVFAGFIYLLWRSFRKGRDNPAVQAAGLSLLAILVFAFFSYPFKYPFVWVAALLSITIIVNKAIVFNYPLKIILILFGVAGLALSFINVRDELLWRKIDRKSLAGQTGKVLAQYEYLHKKLSRNKYFLYNYAYVLGDIKEYEKAITVAKECGELWADYYIQLMMAENYFNSERYSEAERHFSLAANMCPSRFTPLYKLVKIYVETGRKNEALAMAGRILSKKVKISSATINSIKKEMRQYIDENKPKTYNIPKIKY